MNTTNARVVHYEGDFISETMPETQSAYAAVRARSADALARCLDAWRALNGMGGAGAWPRTGWPRCEADAVREMAACAVGGVGPSYSAAQMDRLAGLR